MTFMRYYRLIILWFMVLTIGLAFAARAENQFPEKSANVEVQDATIITGIRVELSGEDYTLRVECSDVPTYTMYELFDPLRIVLDIADASIGESVSLPLGLEEGPVSLVQGRTLIDNDPALVRLELLMTEQRSYSAEREANDIVLTFPKEATIIYDVEITKSPAETRVFIRSNGVIREYGKEELGNDGRLPARMYLDIKDVAFANYQREVKVGTALERIRMAQQKNGVRVVFDSAQSELFSYEIESKKDGLEVVVQEASAQVIARGGKKPAASQAAMEKIAEHEPDIQKDSPASSLSAPTTASAPASQDMMPTKPISSSIDSFAFSGYENQRITIDFYKIDLHNVFRLFGEISGRNIVIDEGVGGSLTLALNDVPWDFALDIILNLKDLQKEERFNTIVISPKSKNFQWPERKLDNLAVKDVEGSLKTSVDPLSIKKRLEAPKEVVEAKKLMMAARAAEKKEEYDEALKYYEDAFGKWPENVKLANRIASLYLVNKGMNAKAVHYAKEALKINPDDRNAALYAAIGLANMKKSQAAQYFKQAVNDSKPSSEALISYAVFSEEKKDYVSALLLLSRHEALYGDSLETMVAKARIYDKEGNTQKAMTEYRAILLSGYELPPDLNRFIKGRLDMEKSKQKGN